MRVLERKMSIVSTKPIVFISYAHADEPDNLAQGEVQWLTFVRQYLQPAVKDGIFELSVDSQMMGGSDWDPEIEQKLLSCDIFILLVSANSMASNYIIDREIPIIRERQAKGHEVYFYPLLLTPTPDAGLNKVRDKTLRPRDVRPFSSFSNHDRLQHMTEAANEIAQIATQITKRKAALQPSVPFVRPTYVHISALPETAYEQLLGRDDELKRLDDAWTGRSTNIISLIAEGGAGKSALVNDWLKRIQADNYRGAQAVLGWSFYSQGSNERAAAADECLDWILEKLSVKVDTVSATAKGEAIAEMMAKSKVLLVLDGVEPLQHGPDSQVGALKDSGLRSLLRRFAAMPPADVRGLIVLTSRLAVTDIARWKEGAAPVVDVEQLSDQAGAALLRDNGVWGTRRQLRATSRDFGGHPLALGLLASFLKETQFGDVRRCDHIRAWTDDPDNPRHDHAKRVMESYEKEWLAGRPVLLAIMYMVGLFDRPATPDCLKALRRKPQMDGLTDSIINLNEENWSRAVFRLREVKLLAPFDPSAPDTLDSHPLVRDWFSEQLKRKNEKAWRAAHSRLYEHLRDNTWESREPKLEELSPLYQAITHGCRAGRHDEVLKKIYRSRICRELPNGKLEYYASHVLGALSSNLASISWFFDKPYEVPIPSIGRPRQNWILSEAAFYLRAQGRLAEALEAQRASLQRVETDGQSAFAALAASSLSETQLLAGEVASAIATASRSLKHATRSGDKFRTIVSLVAHATALHAAGFRNEAEHGFATADRRQQEWQPEHPTLYGMQGYRYSDLLIGRGDWIAARDRATRSLDWAKYPDALVAPALDRLVQGRAYLALALQGAKRPETTRQARDDAHTSRARLGQAADGLRAAGRTSELSCSLLAHAAFWRCIGAWEIATRALDEVEEIAEPGPMRLLLCDTALERARLAVSQIEAFVPFYGMFNSDPQKGIADNTVKPVRLWEEAWRRLNRGRELITQCGYHRRDDELTELEAVLNGEKRFSDLPPRV